MNHTRRSLVRLATRAACLLGVAACSHARSPGGGRPPVPDVRGEFELQVVNHHWLDVDVYIVHDGERTQVGTVVATTAQNFVVSGRLLGASRRIYLVGEAIGSPAMVRTEALIVQPGQYIEWTLEIELSRSSVGVY